MKLSMETTKESEFPEYEAKESRYSLILYIIHCRILSLSFFCSLRFSLYLLRDLHLISYVFSQSFLLLFYILAYHRLQKSVAVNIHWSVHDINALCWDTHYTGPCIDACLLARYEVSESNIQWYILVQTKSPWQAIWEKNDFFFKIGFPNLIFW